IKGARIFIERIRRGGEIFAPFPATVLQAGDRVALLGRTEVLVNVVGPAAAEITDQELLSVPVASFDIYVTGKALVGKTLQQIVETVDEARGVLLRGVTRHTESIPVGRMTVVERGDIL